MYQWINTNFSIKETVAIYGAGDFWYAANYRITEG